jgi:PAS domain S-box-containing protein
MVCEINAMKAVPLSGSLRHYVILSRIMSWLTALTVVVTIVAWWLKGHYLEDFIFATLLALSLFLFILNRKTSLSRVAWTIAEESATDLRSTPESLIEGCQIIDFNWRYVYLNGAAAEHGHNSVEDLAGRTMMEAFPGIENTEMFAVLRRCMENRQAAVIENDFLAPGGSGGSFQLVIQPVPQGLFILWLDISERKRAEAASRNSEALFNAFMEASPTLKWVKDNEGRYLYVNRAWVEAMGFPRAEALGKTLVELIGTPDAEKIAGNEREVLRSNQPLEITQESNFHGEPRFWRSIYFPFQNPSGQRFVGGISLDITEYTRVEEELRETSRRNRDMLANLNLIGVMLDQNATVTYCNDYLLHLTGRTRQEVLGANWFALFIPAAIADEMRKTFSRLIADAPPAWHYDNEILTRSGKRLLIRWNNSLLRSPAGDVIGTASIGEDITERKSLEQQIARAQRLDSLGSLAGGIAHDLNNLLMPILMGVTLLRRFDQDARSLKAIDNIERSVRRGSDLVKQILLFARGGDSSFRKILLGESIREVLAIAATTFPRNIKFEVEVAKNLRPVLGDPTQLSQILLNLSVNARDAMPNGGQISISASNAVDPVLGPKGMTEEPYVVLEVTDTGQGIPQEIIGEIFDPFFTTKEVGKGTGLGLSTVQGITRNHGGFLTVTSAPGAGSTFKIYFPAQLIETGIPASDVALHPPAGHGEIVMIVDDDASVRAIAEQTLEAFGYVPLTAEDGARAIEIFAHRHAEIAAVITDMVMPVMDGIALIASLKNIDPGVRIVATTGSPDYQATLAKAGAGEILSKPFTVDTLLRAVASVLSTRQAS